VLLCSVCCRVKRHIAREKETHDLSQQRQRSRHEDDYFFFWCVRTEFIHRSIRRLRFIQGKNKRREKILPLLWTMVFLHIYRTACLSTHTHTRSNLFKRYGYEFFCFWRGKHGGTSFYRRTRAFRFASRSSFEAAIFCASLLVFFLFPSAAKVIFLPPPLVRRRGERCAILASDAKANLSEGREKVIEAFF